MEKIKRTGTMKRGFWALIFLTSVMLCICDEGWIKWKLSLTKPKY